MEPPLFLSGKYMAWGPLYRLRRTLILMSDPRHLVSRPCDSDFNDSHAMLIFTQDIALVGLTGAGKTSFIDRLKRPQQATGDIPPLPQTTPTIGTERHILVPYIVLMTRCVLGYIIDEVPYRKHTLTLWDFSAPAQLESGHLGRCRLVCCLFSYSSVQFCSILECACIYLRN